MTGMEYLITYSNMNLALTGSIPELSYRQFSINQTDDVTNL